MKKYIALLLCAVFSFTTLSACTTEDTTQTTATEEKQTEIKLDACGLSYTVPASWTENETASVIPTSYAQPEGSIYAVVRYDFVPDENLEQLNGDVSNEADNAEWVAPLVEFLVVREGEENSDAVKAELEKYASQQELPKQEGFLFYFLTEPTQEIPAFSAEAQALYETMVADLPALYDTVETFQPDEAAVTEQAQQQSSMLSFMTTDLEGNAIDSSVFASYDLTVVNFFASYSYPDINELAELESFSQSLKKAHPNVNFLQVIIDTPDAKAEEAILAAYEENGVTYTGIKPDTSMANWILSNLAGLPTTIFVDKDGKVLDQRLEGKQTADTYLTTTQQVLESITQNAESTENTENTENTTDTES